MIFPQRARRTAVRLTPLRVVGEGILFGRTLALAEPPTTLLRSAQSRVSLVARLTRPARTPSPPCTGLYQHAVEGHSRPHPLSRGRRASLGALSRVSSG